MTCMAERGELAASSKLEVWGREVPLSADEARLSHVEDVAAPEASEVPLWERAEPPAVSEVPLWAPALPHERLLEYAARRRFTASNVFGRPERWRSIRVEGASVKAYVEN